MKFVKIPSPNFDKKERTVKYIIIHYTGMKSQKVAIKRLQSKVAKVSTHYLISKRGQLSTKWLMTNTYCLACRKIKMGE